MKKRISFMVVLIFVMVITGCSNISNTSTSGKDYSSLTPEQILDTAFSALRTADGRTFNDCVVYPDEEHNNVYFGDGMDDEDGYISALFKHLSYEILTTDEQKDTTIFTCQISNKDFGRLDMGKYSDAENPMVSAIENSNAPILSHKIELKLKKIDNQWKIMIDDLFTTTISGGHWKSTW